MNTRIAAVALGLSLLSVGCNQLADIAAGTLLECQTKEDCAAYASDCREDLACEAGRCTFKVLAEGLELPEQTPGDCARRVCTRDGEVEIIRDPEDKDDDNVCTLDLCEGAAVVHVPLAEAPCYTGPPGTQGEGICAPGVQRCEDGKPVGGCEGQMAPLEENCISPYDDDCDGQANEEGPGCVCVPGQTLPCYGGPPGTLGKGICKEGVQVCNAEGLGYLPCTGEQPPLAETCFGGAVDEDCDGEINEDGLYCVCGDGWLSEGEQCDDGNLINDDACSNACKVATCGDGIKQPGMGEVCDDGDLDSTDACNANCQFPGCGDGFVQPGEGCDDGNTGDGDGCPASCLPPAVRVTVGGYYACALFDDGRVKCWGGNWSGQLGMGDILARGGEPGEMGASLPVVNLGPAAVATELVAGDSHTCARLNDGSVKCWGANSGGQLGLGDTAPRGDGADEMGIALPAVNLPGPTVAIAAGSMHTCALLNDGAVKCWGLNSGGQLGLGDTQNRGDGPGEMGELLPDVQLGAGRTAVAIAAGASHTCALLDNGQVKCWGVNWAGQLGLGDTENRGGASSEMGDMLPAVDLGSGQVAVAIAVGSGHTCALLQSGQVKCWGLNLSGQLGVPSLQTNLGDTPGEMGDALPTVDLGTGKTAAAISAGHEHMCALLTDGSAKCWGQNWYGQLGLGNTDGHGDKPGTMGDALPAVDLGPGAIVASIDVRSYRTCASLVDGRVKCWGHNDYGELGLGDKLTRGDQMNEMGDNLPAVSLW